MQETCTEDLNLNKKSVAQVSREKENLRIFVEVGRGQSFKKASTH